MGWLQKQRIAKARDRLLPADEEARLIRQHGEAIRPVLDKLLDEKAAKLGKSYGDAWAGMLAALLDDAKNPSEQQLLSHAEAARMLGCSVATMKRLVLDGRLPKPVKISEHRIGHRLSDLKAFIAASKR